jgi:hypothetical protein
MNISSNFKTGQILNLDYDLPPRYPNENRGRKNGDFEVTEIIENECRKGELLIWLKPLSGHFKEEYPQLDEILQHEDLLLQRIEESKKQEEF